MVDCTVKLLNYNPANDTILSMPRRQYMNKLKSEFDNLLEDNRIEIVYTDLPEDVMEWFDNYGHIDVKITEGIDVDSLALINEINDMLFEVANEDGIFINAYDHITWTNVEAIYPANDRYKNYRRIK